MIAQKQDTETTENEKISKPHSSIAANKII